MWSCREYTRQSGSRKRFGAHPEDPPEQGHGENCEAEKENVKDIGCEEECVMQHLDNSSTVDARDRSPDAGRRLKRYNLALKSHIWTYDRNAKEKEKDE